MRTIPAAFIIGAGAPVGDLSPETDADTATVYISHTDWTYPDRPRVGDSLRISNGRRFFVQSIADKAGVVYVLAMKEAAA